MIINCVRVSNFKCFKVFTFSPIHHELNLLVGENGAGKSTIFESIRILLDKNLSLNDYFNDEDFNDKSKNILIEIDISVDKKFSKLVDVSDYIYDLDGDNVCLRIGFAIRKYTHFEKTGNKEDDEKEEAFNEGFYYSRFSFSNMPTGITDEIGFLYEKYKAFNNIKKLFNVIYIDGSRSYVHFYESNSEFSNLLKKEQGKLETIEVLKPGFDTEILGSEGFKTFFAGTGGNINDEIKKVSLVNDTETKSSLSIETPDNKLPFRILKNLLKINLGGNDIPLEKNSIGWQYIYFTIFTLFSLKDNDDNFNLFLMEEPEAHLHPQMQRKVFNYINNREKSSIYVSTHSQTIVRSIRDIEKTNFIQINGNISLPEIATIGSLNLNKLNTFIDINKAELFFSRGVIFVEGISEEILLPKIFEKKYSNKLEDYGISIVNINGTDFLEYCNLCKSYDIPFVVITDKDLIKNSSGVIEEDYLRRVSGLDSSSLFIAGVDTFEIDLLHGNTEGNNYVFFENTFTKFFKAEKLANSKTNMNNILGSSKTDIVYVDDYKKKFFNNYISSSDGVSKSQFAYYGSEYLNNNEINPPEYICNAFEKITSIAVKK